MMLAELLPHLENVKPRGSRYLATCPAHADRSPSLQVTEGERGILLKCWAGCSVGEICMSLGLRPAELFFDALETNPQQRRAAAKRRHQQQHAREQQAQQQGLLIDALREADYFVQSRRGLDISGWNDDQLDHELHALADAYQLLESEDLHG
jgi:hypothetical protein